VTGGGRRAFVVVLDACGAGALPDAASYGDEGANTLGHLAAQAGGLELPVLGRLGLGCVLELAGVPRSPGPRDPWTVASARLGQGLDDRPLGADGRRDSSCPADVCRRLPAGGDLGRRAQSGRDVVCNRPYNGIEAIDD